jgi:diguanylate cyclase (GGDEF)-like protein
MCLLVLSIDHIDELIESHGTSLVDQLVRRLGQFVVQCLRRPDSVGRLGRHQFGVLAPMTNDLGGMTIANRILQRVRAVRFNTPRGPLSFTVSIGLAAPRSATLSDYVALHEIAARRQQAAQAAGGDRVVFAERDSSVLEAVAESNIAAENAAQAEAETALPQIDAPAASESAAQPRVPVEEEDALPALDMTADDGDDADATQSVAHMLDELPPSLDVITWMIDSGQGERLAVHRRALLCRLLPLLDFAAGDHELHLDTPLAVIRSRLK